MISVKIHKTNSRSCVLDSFATIINCEPDYLMQMIGHDGSVCGFHTQELITPLQKFGYSVTPIELFPAGLYGDSIHGIYFPPHNTYDSNLRRFLNSLNDNMGVIAGKLKKKLTPHAVGWAFNSMLDPADQKTHQLIQYDDKGDPYSFLPDAHFIPSVFWRIQRCY